MRCCKYCRVIFKNHDYQFCPYCKKTLESYEYGDWKDNEEMTCTCGSNVTKVTDDDLDLIMEVWYCKNCDIKFYYRSDGIRVVIS